MKFTPMKYEPVVVSLGKEELWWTYVVYPHPKLRAVEMKGMNFTDDEYRVLAATPYKVGAHPGVPL